MAYNFSLLRNITSGPTGAAAAAHCLAAHGVGFSQCWAWIDNYKLSDLLVVLQTIEPFLKSFPAADKVVLAIEMGLAAIIAGQPCPCPEC